MATVHLQKLMDKDGVTREGEPLPRPYVVLHDGTTMTYTAWVQAGRPN